MKKLSADQFARLTELLTKGNALSEEEKTEKASLESLIVAEDGDETEKEGEEEKEEETPPTDDPETEPEKEEEPTEDPVADEKAFAKLSIKGQFQALFASRAGLVAKLSAAAAQLHALGTQLAAATDRATKAEAALAEATEKLTISEARVATLEAEKKDLHAAVTDELAGIGVDRRELVASDSEGKGGAVEAAYEDFRAAKSPEDKAAAHRRLKAAEAKAKGAKTADLN